MNIFEQVWKGTSLTRSASEAMPATPAEREAAFNALYQSSSGLKRVAFAG